ncbi:MAG: hypothetical protein QOH60_1513 [Mycobacterium sp.]|nr:hypothetical protein [Mycobacterium sp.]
MTASYAVWRPQVSNDTVNVPVVGKLYEAKTTVKAVQGVVTPSIPFFNARTGSGDNYRVLWQAYAPEGLDAATLQQGETATGKIYFDVTGAAPTTVVYNDAVQDRASWGGSGSGGGGGYGGGEAARGAAPSSAGDYHNNPCYPGCL